MPLKTIEAKIDHLLGPIANSANAFVFSTVDVGGAHVPVAVALVAVSSVLLTFWFGFINIRGFRQAFRLVRGDYADPRDRGEVSQFGALSAALAGTLGVGNVAGVAMAITIGGPGAVLWMTLTGFFGMALKFAECTLAVKYRQIGSDGIVNGGPMRYLPIAFGKIRLRPLGVALAVLFSLAMFLASTSLFQVNQAFVQTQAITGPLSPLTFGVIFALMVGLVIVGGMKGIARVCMRLVPAMVLVYFLAAAAVLIAKAPALPNVVLQILHDAFHGRAITGGALGAFVVGVQRAVFAGESGLGSSAVAHAAAKTNEPVSEGIVSLFEPFVSTVFVCNLTAFVILAAGSPVPGGTPGGVEIASAAFVTVLPWFARVLAVIIALLAYKTIVAWAYYGERAWGWLVGEGQRRRLIFRVGYLSAIAIAPVLSPSEAIRFIDAMMFAMAVPNIIALYLMAGELKQDLADYFRKINTAEVLVAK